MKSYLKISIALYLIIVVAHFVAKNNGLYGSYALTDIILHTLSGIMLGYFWMWLLQKYGPNSMLISLVSIVSFAVAGSALWEVWEYGGWSFVPNVTNAYIPVLTDSLGDIVCGLVGGIIAALIYGVNRSREKLLLS